MSKLREFTASSPRPLPVIILADVSGSMSTDGKIDVLNTSVREMINSFSTEEEDRALICLAVITFGKEGAQIYQDLKPAAELSWPDMSADGKTPLGAALDLAVSMIEDRDIIPSRSYTPTIVLVSDGKPTDDWEPPLERLLTSERASKAQRFALGIGDDADFVVLSKFLARPNVKVFEAQDARNIKRFFRWVTDETILLESGSNRLRIVPLVSAIAASKESYIDSFLSQLNAARSEIADTLILYPAPFYVVASKNIISPVIQQLISLRHDLPLDPMGPSGILPVSPWDLGSVERVARAIRWTFLGHNYTSFPPVYADSESLKLIDLDAGDWLTYRKDGGLAMVSAPNSKDLQELGLDNFITKMESEIKDLEERHDKVSRELKSAVKDHVRTSELNSKKHAFKTDLTNLKAKLDKAKEVAKWIADYSGEIRRLLRCPVCRKEAPAHRDFLGNDDGYFECNCEGCGASWGTRKCGNCKNYYPIIIPNNIPELSSTASVGWLDRVFGRDVLSAPCQSSADSVLSFMCPVCHKCS